MLVDPKKDEYKNLTIRCSNMSVSGTSTSTRLVDRVKLSNVEEIMELQIARTGNHFKKFCNK